MVSFISTNKTDIMFYLNNGKIINVPHISPSSEISNISNQFSVENPSLYYLQANDGEPIRND